MDVACVAGVGNGRGREFGRKGKGMSGTPAKKLLFLPSRLPIRHANIPQL